MQNGILILCILLLAAGVGIGFFIGFSRSMQKAAEKLQTPSGSSRMVKWIGYWVAFGALICLTVSVVNCFQTKGFLGSAIKANGVISALKNTHGEHGTSYAPVVRFEDASKITHEVTSRFSSSPPGFSVGEKVEVLYQPSDPDNARINTFWQVWGPTLLSAMIGGGFMLVSLLFVNRARSIARTDSLQPTIRHA